VAPSSHIDIDLLSSEHTGTLSCDGRRSHDLPLGAQVRIERAERPIKVARPHPTPFGERLVAKFQLPVRSFRDAGPTTL
jgi:NAD+ kinase